MPDSLQVDFPPLLDEDEVLKEERFAGIAGGDWSRLPGHWQLMPE